MNSSDFFNNLNFEDRRLSPTQRIIFVGSLLGGFALLWFSIGHGIVFWVLLLALGILGWVASYGWRQALSALHDFIHQLEQN